VSESDFTKRLSQQLREMADSPLVKAAREMAESPQAKALREMVDGPHAKALREMVDGPQAKALREMVDGPHAKALREMVDGPQAKALREMVDGPLAQRMRAWTEASVPETWRGFESRPEMQRFVKQISDFQVAARTFVLPTLDTVPQLASGISRIIEPYRATAIADDRQGRLARKISELNQPWAIAGLVNPSAAGFARLVRLSDAAHVAAPFSESISELFASELGGHLEAFEASAASRDAAAVSSGLQADLIAFPPASYGSIVLTAGFRFNVMAPPLPQAIEAADPDAVYDSNHSTLLSTVEQHLRQFVEDRLLALEGPSWVKKRVSEAARKQWAERQAEDRQLGRPVYGLIHYADFMDLADVITQRNNWREAFAGIFGNADDLRMSLHRLHPVRKAIAHSRPLRTSRTITATIPRAGGV
jgi:hypothetical protein